MVRLLCVIVMNCERLLISRMSRVKRVTFASSSGASTSSSMQKGLGFTRKAAKRRAMAVSARSPPDRSVML